MPDCHLRQASFAGLRSDKEPQHVVREKIEDTPFRYAHGRRKLCSDGVRSFVSRPVGARVFSRPIPLYYEIDKTSVGSKLTFFSI